jgi:hypothetical protein
LLLFTPENSLSKIGTKQNQIKMCVFVVKISCNRRREY